MNNKQQSDLLRTIADFLDTHADIPVPHITIFNSGTAWVAWNVHIGASNEAEQKAVAARIIRTVGGKWDKDFDWPDEQNRADFKQIHPATGLDLRVTVTRDAVCERVVVGTETVTVPAIEAQPEQTVERELVEWRCEPLLAEVVR